MTLTCIEVPSCVGLELQLVDAALLARPTRDYMTRLAYVETVIREQQVGAAQRMVSP